MLVAGTSLPATMMDLGPWMFSSQVSQHLLSLAQTNADVKFPKVSNPEGAVGGETA